MATILDAVVPLFAVILLGFAAGRTGWIDARGVKALVTFVFYVAMPPLLFRLVAKSELAELVQGGFMVCYVGAQIGVALLGVWLGRTLFRLGPAALVIQGFGSAFPNSVLLGLPLLLSLYGERGALPATLIFSMNVFVYSFVTLLLQLTQPGRWAGALEGLVWPTLRAIIGNPIIMAACGGLAFGALGLTLPTVVDHTFGFIGSAGPPTALFALGASLGVGQVAGRWGQAGAMVACKLVVHPLLAWLLAVPILGLTPFYAQTAIIMAALPVGANVFIFAQQYDVSVEQTSSAIFVSTGIAMVTIPAVLWLIV